MTSAVRAEDITIPGTGNCEYILLQLSKAFNASQKRHRVSVPPSTGTAGALRDINEGKTAIGRVGRPLKDEERAKVKIGMMNLVYNMKRLGQLLKRDAQAAVVASTAQGRGASAVA